MRTQELLKSASELIMNMPQSNEKIEWLEAYMDLKERNFKRRLRQKPHKKTEPVKKDLYRYEKYALTLGILADNLERAGIKNTYIQADRIIKELLNQNVI